MPVFDPKSEVYGLKKLGDLVWQKNVDVSQTLVGGRVRDGLIGCQKDGCGESRRRGKSVDFTLHSQWHSAE